MLCQVESFDGVMIATTNRPDLVDVAFRRRFDIWVEFSEPSDRERSELWRQLFPPQAPLAKSTCADTSTASLFFHYLAWAT